MITADDKTPPSLPPSLQESTLGGTVLNGELMTKVNYDKGAALLTLSPFPVVFGCCCLVP